MSLPRIRDEYRVPARLGARVSWTHPHMNATRVGTITGCKGDFVQIDCGIAGTYLVKPSRLTFLPDNPTTEEN